MIDRQLAKKYARGLFAVGEKDGKYKSYREELDKFLLLLKENELFYRAVMLPIYDMSFKKEIVGDVAKKMDLSMPVLNLLLLLVENDRLRLLPFVAQEYSKFVDEKENVIRGKLYSPYPVENEVVREIETILKEKLKKDVVLTIFEEKSLIGGLKLILDGIIIDGSIRKQLDMIKETLLKE